MSGNGGSDRKGQGSEKKRKERKGVADVKPPSQWETDDMYQAIVPWDLTLCTTARERQGTAAC